jgi:hypothetical protein
VSDPNEGRNPEFDLESSRLKYGLKSCRAVIDNYRAMLGGGRSRDRRNDQSRESSYGSWGGETEGAT